MTDLASERIFVEMNAFKSSTRPPWVSNNPERSTNVKLPFFGSIW